MIGARDSEEFRVRLLNEAGGAVLADIHFGPRVPGEGQHIRFSYAASNKAIEDGVARLAAFVRGKQVSLTIDLDGLDPSIMPAVGTPEPGGVTWRELLALLKLVFTRKTVVAADVVELCPIPGLVAPNFLAARLVYKLVGYQFFAR